MNKFFHEDICERTRNTGILLLVTFEYDVFTAPPGANDDSKSPVHIHTRLLGTRRFRYLSKDLSKPDPTITNTTVMSLNGSFLL